MSRFSIWVEYDYGTSDLDAWICHVAKKESCGGGHMLTKKQTRDLEFEAATSRSAIALARRIAKVMKLARNDVMRREPGSWQVRVRDRNADEYDQSKIWSASGREIGLLIKYKPRRKRKKKQ